MGNYRQLITDLRMFGLRLYGEETSIMQTAADAIEQLMNDNEQLTNDYEILAKMYARVNEDLCVRTKERDAAIRDMREYLDCGICKYNTDEYLENGWCRECSVGKSTREHWEWRGVSTTR